MQWKRLLHFPVSSGQSVSTSALFLSVRLEQVLSKEPLADEPAPSIFFVKAHFSLLLRVEHIAGVSKSAANNRSRDNLTKF